MCLHVKQSKFQNVQDEDRDPTMPGLAEDSEDDDAIQEDPLMPGLVEPEVDIVLEVVYLMENWNANWNWN